MYQYMYPSEGVPPMCCYCFMASRNGALPVMPMETESMFRTEEEFDENRMGMGQQMPGMGQQMPGMGQQMPGMGQQMPGMGQQMPGMGQQMPGMMDMSKMDMGKIEADTQEIIRMFEEHHPDMLKTLTNSGMSMGQARQYLTSIVKMSLMHHMMHQM